MTDDFRTQRIENYRLKHAAGFQCEHVRKPVEPLGGWPQGKPEPPVRCKATVGLLVCRTGKKLTVRCRQHHVGSSAIGQWDTRYPNTPMGEAA